MLSSSAIDSHYVTVSTLQPSSLRPSFLICKMGITGPRDLGRILEKQSLRQVSSRK